MFILFLFFTFINSIRYTHNTCILFQVSVCKPDLPPCSFSIFMFMKNSISFVVWKKETPSNNPAIPPTSAIIERPVTRYVSVLEYLRAIIRYTPYWSALLVFTACLVYKNQFRNWFLHAKNPVHQTWLFQLDFLKFKYRSTGEQVWFAKWIYMKSKSQHNCQIFPIKILNYIFNLSFSSYIRQKYQVQIRKKKHHNLIDKNQIYFKYRL